MNISHTHAYTRVCVKFSSLFRVPRNFTILNLKIFNFSFGGYLPNIYSNLNHLVLTLSSYMKKFF